MVYGWLCSVWYTWLDLMRSLAHRSIQLAAVVAGSSALSPQALAQGCAMCRTAVQSPDDPLALGINVSVAMMMIVPFAVVGSIGGWLAFVYRRAHRLAATGTPPVGAPQNETLPGSTEETP